MQTAELVEYIFESRADVLVPWFSRATTSSAPFMRFLMTYRDKIRKKARSAPTGRDGDEALSDVLAEIEIAYLLLLAGRFSKVEYERYGTEEQHPDFTVTDDRTGMVFNVEVKRIRSPEHEKRLDRWKRDLAVQVSAVESGLAVSIDIEPGGDPRQLLDRLETQKDDIWAFVKRAIAQAEGQLPEGSKAEHSVPGFDGLVSFEIRRPARKTSPRTSYYGGSFPILATDREYRKLGDEICDPVHLGQLRAGMVNVLAITTDSGAHDVFDLTKAVTSLMRLAEQGDDVFFSRKGFAGVGDFVGQIRRLSALLFRSRWEQEDHTSSFLWSNGAAECPAPDEIAGTLKGMEYPDRVALLHY